MEIGRHTKVIEDRQTKKNKLNKRKLQRIKAFISTISRTGKSQLLSVLIEYQIKYVLVMPTLETGESYIN